MNIQEFEPRLKMERDLLGYLRLLKEGLKHYIIIIAVADTGAAQYFTSECAQAMLDLGLKINMLQRYLQPYIGIIDQGHVIYEDCSENLEQPLWVEGKINRHDIAVYSAGFKWQHGIGGGAIALIDGANYLINGRGFNFLVYDPKRDDIIDSCVFDTNEGGDGVHAVNQISKALLSFADKYKGIQMCFISFPQRPTPYSLDLTPFEELLIKEDPKSKLLDWVGNKEKMYSVWNNKEVPYCSDYKNAEEFYEAFQTPNSFISLDGYRRYDDFYSSAVNTRNGVRVTVDQPKDFKRSIFFVGNCRFFGWGSTDENTPASLLQKELNLQVKEQGIIVHDYSYVGADRYIDLLATLRSLPLRNGDIVFFQDRFFQLKDCIAPWGIPYCDLRYNSIRPNKYGEIFMDKDFHTSSNGNRMIADGIFDFLKRNNFFADNISMDLGTPIHINQSQKEDEDKQLSDYKEKLKLFYQRNICPKIGSVVMNCNPFTLGHRYLVEQALKSCDCLVVFVVEEDKSVFPFVERIKLVKKNLADLKNVYVIPSGKFIISSRTFKEYFNKESMQDYIIDTSMDVTIFGKDIAPCLNISIRFVGEEPFDSITRQYNESMAKILPQYGVRFIEIPRMEYNGKPISASEVRRLVDENKFDELKEIVSELTLQYLYNRTRKKQHTEII